MVIDGRLIFWQAVSFDICQESIPDHLHTSLRQKPLNYIGWEYLYRHVINNGRDPLWNPDYNDSTQI